MNNRVDLSLLAVDRNGSTTPTPRRIRRRWFTRIVVPLGIGTGFFGLLAWSARDSFLPKKSVTVVPVIASRAEIQRADSPLFQAAGWVEPRPTPVIVSALAEGIIDRLVVLEGQQVKAGEPVAYLIDRDAKLAVDDAEATLSLHQSEVAAAQAKLTAAKTIAAEPIQRQAELAEADAQLARVETELSRAPFQLDAAKSRLKLAKTDLDNKSGVSDALANLTLPRARSEFEIATASVEEQIAHTRALERERQALSNRRDVLRRQLSLKTDETRQAAEAEANSQSAKARLRQAAVALESARLKLERMVVRSPSSGRVLALVARPGAKVMGMAPNGMSDASTVATLYDPANLQIRADVRLEDLRRVQTGQNVRIETSATASPLTGKVLVATSLADIQKNTLQVKVAIDNPPPVIKPDMLVQVTFLSASLRHSNAKATNTLRLLVPRSLVDSAVDPATVWVAELATGVAGKRVVKLGEATDGDLVETLEGLAVGDRLIASGRESLKEGQRISISSEDNTIGKEIQSSPAKSASTKHQHSAK